VITIANSREVKRLLFLVPSVFSKSKPDSDRVFITRVLTRIRI